MFAKLIEETSEINKSKNKNKEHYTYDEIYNLVQKILQIEELVSLRGATPIVKITQDLGIKVYKEDLGYVAAGKILIGGRTKEDYGYDKVILVNANDHLFQQRFVTAYMLAYYLLGFIGNDDSTKLNLEFSHDYIVQNKTKAEQNMLRFAKDMMMPREVFREQFLVASDISHNWLVQIYYLTRFFEIHEAAVMCRLQDILHT